MVEWGVRSSEVIVDRSTGKNRILINGSVETDMFMTIVDTSMCKIRQSCLGMCGRNRYVPIRAMERYYTSHTKTTLPTRQSVPRFIRQLDHTKTSWPSKETKLKRHGQVSPSSCKVQWKRKEDKAGKKRTKTKKRWEDNIREWTGLEFTKSKRAVEKIEK